MKAVVVTGATSGIGYAVCKELLESGFAVIGIGRNSVRCEAALAGLGQAHGASVRFISADLMSQHEVLRAAREVEGIIDGEFGGKLHALINNAGCVRSRYMTTPEGYEQQFALNYLAGFLLTHELLPLITRAEGSVIFTGSKSHKMMRVNWDDLMYQRRYRPLFAYKQSKLCNLLLAHNLRERGVRACCVDPGLVATDIGNKNTAGLVDFVWKRRKKHGVSPSIPAQTYKALCVNGFPGLYYGHGARERRYNRQVNGENARRLYDISLKLCGMEGLVQV